MGKQWSDGYSARVRLGLRVDGARLEVAQVGPDSLILREPRVIAPSTIADLIIEVDDKVEVTSVILAEGASRTDARVKYF